MFLQEKESLITELRKELRVSDEEHRELLSRVNADDIIRRIRSFDDWMSYTFLKPSRSTQFEVRKYFFFRSDC